MSARIGGRPTRYSEAIASAICRLVREGEYLKSICQQDGMPSLNTVYHWRQDNQAFSRRYAIAREFHAETLADKIRETVDGAEGCTLEEIQARRLKFDGYRYLAGRYFPRMFGDKLIHTGGDGEGPVAVKLSLDYTLLEPREMVEFRRMLAKMERRPDETPLIEGGDFEDDDGEGGS
jgi:hypothetical protein